MQEKTFENGRSRLVAGDVFYSPGMSFRFEVIAPICTLYDREILPYPSCSLDWKGKQPSWRRIGKRFVPDMADRGCETYLVRLLNAGTTNVKTEQKWTFTYRKMTKEEKLWWWGAKK